MQVILQIGISVNTCIKRQHTDPWSFIILDYEALQILKICNWQKVVNFQKDTLIDCDMLTI